MDSSARPTASWWKKKERRTAEKQRTFTQYDSRKPTSGKFTLFSGLKTMADVICFVGRSHDKALFEQRVSSQRTFWAGSRQPSKPTSRPVRQCNQSADRKLLILTSATLLRRPNIQRHESSRQQTKTAFLFSKDGLIPQTPTAVVCREKNKIDFTLWNSTAGDAVHNKSSPTWRRIALTFRDWETNQIARKALFTCVVYTNLYSHLEWSISKFPLPPHRKCYVTQYEELGFS